MAGNLAIQSDFRPEGYFHWSEEKKQLFIMHKKEGIPLADIAKDSGVSRSLLSRFLNEKGYSPGEEHLKKLQDYFKKSNHWEEDQNWIENIEKLEVIKTKCVMQVFYVLNTAKEGNGFGLITGPSGCGKTTAVKMWLKDHPEEAIFITANGAMTRKAIVKRIAQALGINSAGDADSLIEKVARELTENPKLIIIDEADQIGRVDKLETLRTILDETGTIGIVLIANEDLSDYILQISVDKRALARIHNRFVAFQKVKMPTEDEAKRWLERVNSDEFAKNRLIWLLRLNDGRGGYRVVKNMLRTMFKAVGNKKIDSDLITSDSLRALVLSANS